MKEFVPEIAQRKLAKESAATPKSDIVLPAHYDRMQNINHQHGMKRIDPEESQTRVRAVVAMALLNNENEEQEDFSFASLRANGSVELWQSQQAKLNKHASYQRLSLSADIFETAKDKSPIATVPVKPLALEAIPNSDKRVVACDTHGNLVILKTDTTTGSDHQPKILHNFQAFSNCPDNVTLTYTKGKVMNTQLASAMTLKETHAAIGGRERDIRFINLETGQCTWKAKNLPPDPQTLMQQPVWASSMTFLPDNNNNLLAVGTGFGQVRIYDVRSNIRRPLQYTPEKSSSLEHRITAICGTSEHQVVAGDTTGDLHALDLRVHFTGQRYNQHDTAAVTMGRYIGPSGSVRQLKKHPTLPVLAAVGCDRILRTYDTNKQKVIDCVYLKQRLNCVLMCGEGRLDDEDDYLPDQTSGEFDINQEDVVKDYVDSDKDSDDESESEGDNANVAVSQSNASESDDDEQQEDGDSNESSESASGSESESSDDEVEEAPKKRRKR